MNSTLSILFEVVAHGGSKATLSLEPNLIPGVLAINGPRGFSCVPTTRLLSVKEAESVFLLILVGLLT